MSSEIEETEELPEEEPITDIELLEDYLEEEEASDEPAGMWARFLIMLVTILPGTVAGQLVTFYFAFTGTFNILLNTSAGSVAIVLTLIMWIALFVRALYWAQAKFIFTNDYGGIQPKARRLRVEAIRTLVRPKTKEKYKRLNMRDLFRSVDISIKRMISEQTVFKKQLEKRGFTVKPKEPEPQEAPDQEIEDALRMTWSKRFKEVIRANWIKFIIGMFLAFVIYEVSATYLLWLPVVVLLWSLVLFTPEGHIAGLILLAVFVITVIAIVVLRRKLKPMDLLVVTYGEGQKNDQG